MKPTAPGWYWYQIEKEWVPREVVIAKDTEYVDGGLAQMGDLLVWIPTEDGYTLTLISTMKGQWGPLCTGRPE